MMGNIEILIHNLAMAAWDAGCESGVVWCPDADMSKRGVVPMTQEEGLRDSREHFATHGGGAEASEFDSALRSLRAALDATRADNTDPKPTTHAEWDDLENERDSLRAERDRLASELQAVRGELATARDALRGIWPFIEEDDGGFTTPAYQKAINDVRAALAMTEDANP